jgi:uncharacterized repeat protein (TIGR02543 family)
VVTVTVGANPAKALTSFSFASPAASGTITESAKTVALTVPFGTDVTALKASFVSTGASVKVGTVVQTSGTTQNNFTSPVTYTVVAADGSTQAYVVTVTIGANSAIIIATQPQDQTKCIGSPASFSVSANTAVGTLSYQWKNASGNLTEGHFVGTATNSLSISAVAAGDAGTYSCYITSTGGGSPVTSSGAKLTVNTLSSTPTLAANVTSVCAPGSVIFTITGTLGTGANWQVYAGSTKLSTQPTITSNSFTISNISAATSYSIKAEGGTCDNSSSPPTSNNVAIALTSYSVTFNSNGGSPVPTVQTITCNSIATAPTQAPVKTGYTFVGWYLDTSSSTAFNFSTPITGATTLNAKWTIKQFALTIIATNGSVTKSPNASQYDSGTVVTLIPIAAAGYQFTGWSGGLTGTTNPGSITMTGAMSVTATFALKQFALTITATNGSVTKSPNAAQYDSGTVVSLTPVPAAGYQFTGWSGSLTGTANPGSITMTAAKSVTATFTLKQFTLTITATNGTVTKSPNAAQYDSGTVVSLTPVPAAGYQFTGWSGGLTGTANPGSITMNSAKSVTANFVLTYQVIYNGNGNLIGIPPNDNNHYQAGATVSVFSGSNNMSRNGYVFVGWKGGPADTNTKTFTMPANNVTLNAQWDVRDTDGNHYDTIVINTSFGTQTWMVQNLKTTRYNNGASIPHVNGSTDWSKLSSSASAYCWYNDDITNKNNYGALYNFNAVNTGKLAPKGWHVATDGDFEALNDFLLNTPAYISNFAPYFGGSVSGGLFGELDQIGNWWSSTYVDPGSGSVMFYIQSYSGRAGMNDDILTDGLSVRCIRGDPSQ